MIDKKVRRDRHRSLEAMVVLICQYIVAISIVASTALGVYSCVVEKRSRDNVPQVLPARSREKPVTYDVSRFDRSLFTPYEIAQIVTGAPADVVKGICYAESSLGKNLKHTDPLDKGPFGLRVTYQAERERKWGKFDANDMIEAAIITGRIFMENKMRLGNEDLAIAAHNQGVNGVRDHGPNLKYVARVRKGSRA